ncbi:dTDP-4-dehydrorhamnose 3,5-epimerase [Longilinea arvoryzae]|uniref:dTDP-4-dehydrorhamnose 3,5-epimerase n=1 Tax=Longilinea arvoryzae TaxID=360412 RepID=A0A0S7B8V6_9CHLR|nr:dTDP-4-dehydrorhamnose 3,5-epimerase [Longilinea arvoryzae]GAP13948.1 dTDP-4-dehydrorhamnose 3,5-epimerase [Longilinea arvoryzae]
MAFEISSTQLSDILLLEPRVFADERGFFMETYQSRDFARLGIPDNFVQDNQSGSRRGILRGLHYQILNPQGKLVRCIVGEIFDVAVDLRRSSPTFGRWTGTYLSAENKRQLWIPIGFAHGFFTVSEWAEVLYKASDYYNPKGERCVLWNDPQIGVQWPVPAGESPLLSPKDQLGLPLAQAETFD